jgi:hypothetical protein
MLQVDQPRARQLQLFVEQIKHPLWKRDGGQSGIEQEQVLRHGRKQHSAPIRYGHRGTTSNWIDQHRSAARTRSAETLTLNN